MNTLYIRLPSMFVADSVANWLELICPFALVSHAGAIEREGMESLSVLSGKESDRQHTVLLLAASDVMVVRVKVPPLSPARLKAALPNLVEELLFGDPADCTIVAGGLSGGLRTIAAVQRVWLVRLKKTFGAQHIVALPAQSCVSIQSDPPDMASAAVGQWGGNIDLTLCFPDREGLGVALDVASGGEAAQEVIQTLCAVVPTANISLYVPQTDLNSYQEAVAATPALQERIVIHADNWARWIAGARGTTLDLMVGLEEGGTVQSFDGRSWRWPLALGGAALFINVVALNIDWWRMKSEADALRSTMELTYRAAYPHESVILDPIAQMRQKVVAAKRASGQAVADDFTAITASFGEAWASVTATLAMPPVIAALDYRERSLSVRLKGREALTQQMEVALAERGLSLMLAPAQSGVVWQIRRVK